MLLPHTITITHLERDMMIEALAACIALAANDVPEAKARLDRFTALLAAHERKCRELLSMLLKSTPVISLTERVEAKELAKRVAEKWGIPSAANEQGFIAAVAKLLASERDKFLAREKRANAAAC